MSKKGDLIIDRCSKNPYKFPIKIDALDLRGLWSECDKVNLWFNPTQIWVEIKTRGNYEGFEITHINDDLTSHLYDKIILHEYIYDNRKDGVKVDDGHYLFEVFELELLTDEEGSYYNLLNYKIFKACQKIK
tara:strand:- start:4 stop:399 length:396 start_codon:yes stop_codon:yes gene_type:complete